MSTKSKWFLSFVGVWLSALFGSIAWLGLHDAARVADLINFTACVLMALYILTDKFMDRVFKGETFGQALRRNLLGSVNMTQEEYWEKTGTTPEHIKRRRTFKLIKSDDVSTAP